MSLMSEPTSATPGRFLRRLEALEATVREYKQKNSLLQMRVEAVEKWKDSAERWLFENFEVKFDLSMQFEVEKVEVKADLPDNLDTSSMDTGETADIPPEVNNDTSAQKSTAGSPVKSQVSRLSQEAIFSTPQSSPSSVPASSGLKGTFNKKASNEGKGSDDDVQIVEGNTPEENVISIRSVRSLFDSDIEIEESINLGASSAACTPTRKSPAISEIGSRSPAKRVTLTGLNSVRPKLPLVEIDDEEEQLSEPPAGITSMITPNVSVTLQKSNSVTSVTSSPRKTLEQNRKSPIKDKEAPILISTPHRVNGTTNVNGTSTPFPSPMCPPAAKMTNGTKVPPASTSTTSTFKTPKISVAVVPAIGRSSPYKGSAMIKPHRRRSTHSVYNSSPEAVSPASDLNDDNEDDTPCDVCMGTDPELGNEMVFCDSCNVCVHQACYGVRPIPQGKWLCNPCKQGLNTKEIQCRFCPGLGGALKPVQSPAKTHWAHVSCALWIPEVKLGSRTTMEPVINIQRIPKDRWSLRCSLCNEKKGASIQCQFNRKCVRAFHVTCAMKHKLQMIGTVDDDLNDGCELKAYCKIHSSGNGDAGKKRKKSRQKRGVSKSPHKKPRLDPETTSAVTQRVT